MALLKEFVTIKKRVIYFVNEQEDALRAFGNKQDPTHHSFESIKVQICHLRSQSLKPSAKEHQENWSPGDTESMVQGGLGSALTDNRLGFPTCDTAFMCLQNIIVVRSKRLPPRFQRKA